MFSFMSSHSHLSFLSRCFISRQTDLLVPSPNLCLNRLPLVFFFVFFSSPCGAQRSPRLPRERAQSHGNSQQVWQRNEQQPLGLQHAAASPLQDFRLEDTVPDGPHHAPQAAGEWLLLGRHHREGSQCHAGGRGHRHVPHPGQLWQPTPVRPECQDGVGHQEPAHPMWHGLFLPANRPKEHSVCSPLWLRPQAGPLLHVSEQREHSQWDYLLHLLWWGEDPSGAPQTSRMQLIHLAALVQENSQRTLGHCF